MDEIVITLQHPVLANGEELRELRLQRPKVKHLKALDRAVGDVARTAALIAELARIPPSAVDLIDADDFRACGQVLAGFFSGRPPTGGTS